MKRLLTGLKPTGELTIGNYIGAIKPFKEMQNDFDDIYLFVADLHALTIYQDPKELHERIKKFVGMYIACGIDPKKTTVYIQSENNYIPSISYLLECTTYYGEASRMIQFKEKSKQNANFSVGLLTYPILMAADILYCDANFVPVGIDQTQHVELARNIAERFNRDYGETFTLPEAYVRENGAKIKDLKDPTKKMSKSDENPNGVITLFDTREQVFKKIKGATTDSDAKVYFDEENKPGISNLLNIASAMGNDTIDEITTKFEGKNYGEFKEYVAEVVASKLEEIQSKYQKVISSGILDYILDEGAKKSNQVAKEKYDLMVKKMGLGR